MARRTTAGLGGLLALALLLAPTAQAGDEAATQRSLARAMAAAGSHSGAYVVDLDTGEKLYSRRGRVPRVPASVNKLYTTAVALMRFGEGGTLVTEVRADHAPDPATGVVEGNLYLRGGGDPTFGTTAAQTLAAVLTQTQGITAVTGRVIGDESAWDGLRGGPDSAYGVSEWVGPLSALTFNRGRTGRNRPFWQPSPPRAAAKGLKRALTAAGVDVALKPRAGETPDGAVSLARWASPTMAQIVAATNVQSDNFNAESLLKALGERFGAGGTTASGASVVRGSVADFDARPQIVDGSGLSRANRTSARDVVRLLAGTPRRTVPRSRARSRSRPAPARSTTACAAPRPASAAGRRPGRSSASPRSPATARAAPPTTPPSPSS